MASGLAFDKIELSLIRAFHTVITERSVSRAALQLHSSQPAVSAQLKRLRGLIGDPLLVRAGAGMAPTALALSLLPAAAQVLQGAQLLFGGLAATQAFTPQAAAQTFRIAVSDRMGDSCVVRQVACKDADRDVELRVRLRHQPPQPEVRRRSGSL